jgi:hypothetical protein
VLQTEHSRDQAMTAVMTPITPAVEARATTATRTFATGAEMQEWTKRFPSEPPPSVRTSAPPGRPSDRPTPVSPDHGVRPAPRGRATVWLAVVASVLGLSTVMWFLGPPRERAARPLSPKSAVAAPAPSQPAVTPASVRAGKDESPQRVTSSRPPRDRPENPVLPQEPPTPPEPRVPAPPPPASAQAAPVAAGTLDLTSDLPATVHLAGAPVGSTPVRGLQRPAGRYPVVFVSTNLEERVATVVELSAGQTLGVHAEFKRAMPAISLRR